MAVRAAALDALARHPGSTRRAVARLSVVFDKKAPPELVARVPAGARPGGHLPPNDLAGFLDHEASDGPDRGRSRRWPGRSPMPAEAKAAILARSRRPRPEVRNAAIEACGSAQDPRGDPRARGARAKDDGPAAEATGAGRDARPAALPVYLAAIADRNPECDARASRPCWRSATWSEATWSRAAARASSPARPLRQSSASSPASARRRLAGDRPVPADDRPGLLRRAVDRLRPRTCRGRGATDQLDRAQGRPEAPAESCSTISRRARAIKAASATTPTARPTSPPSPTPRSPPTATARPCSSSVRAARSSSRSTRK